MKYDEILKQELIRLAKNFGHSICKNNYAHPTEPINSSLIFKDIEFCFQKDSWQTIINNEDLKKRIQKKHTRVQAKNAGILEMQSSNSSDALAMNIFCHPDIKKSEGVKNLFKVPEITSIDFGYKAKVDKTIDTFKTKDSTEIDVLINCTIFIECKLTEKDFTSREKYIVEHYSDFRRIFQIDKLLKTETKYKNYQLIRNILAANQHNAQFILICDIRRPDLVESFYQTLDCIKDEYFELRNKCKIIYWQDIAKVVGDELKEFLIEKYGVN